MDFVFRTIFHLSPEFSEITSVSHDSGLETWLFLVGLSMLRSLILCDAVSSSVGWLGNNLNKGLFSATSHLAPAPALDRCPDETAVGQYWVPDFTFVVLSGSY